MRGFNGSPAMPPADASFQVFKTSSGFVLPNADNFIVDVFGGGASGGSNTGVSEGKGGGGGARHRIWYPKGALAKGTRCTITVGAGGAAVVGSGSCNPGGESHFICAASGVIQRAYGGGSVGAYGSPGGGIFSRGSTPDDGHGGLPNCNVIISGTNPTLANASSDFGGGHSLAFSGTAIIGNAVWGGAGGGWHPAGTLQAGGTSYYGGGGGGNASNANGAGGGKSGVYETGLGGGNGLDGVIGRLQGGAGSGGNGVGSGGTAQSGGFPSGGGGGASNSGTSGKGGDGLVVIYWW